MADRCASAGVGFVVGSLLFVIDYVCSWFPDAGRKEEPPKE